MSHQLEGNSLFTTSSTQDGVAVSGTNTYYSTPVYKRDLQSVALDLYWGANVGTFTVQVSNKKNPNLANDSDWKTLTLATAISQPSGSNSGDFVDLSDLPSLWVRLKYVNASGTGTIFAYASGQGA